MSTFLDCFQIRIEKSIKLKLVSFDLKNSLIHFQATSTLRFFRSSFCFVLEKAESGQCIGAAARSSTDRVRASLRAAFALILNDLTGVPGCVKET